MDQQLYIRASCTIDTKSIYRNREQVFENKVGNDVVAYLTEAYHHFGINYPRFYKMDNLCKLGWLCNEIMIMETGSEKLRLLSEVNPQSVCLVLCNASSSLDTDQKYYETVSAMASPALFVYTLPNIVMGEICIRNGWKGENIFFIEDQFEPGFLAKQVTEVMKTADNQACICGWIELLGESFKGALYLVQKGDESQYATFTAENLLDIFENKQAFKGN